MVLWDVIFIKFDALFEKKYVKIRFYKLYINVYAYLFRLRKENRLRSRQTLHHKVENCLIDLKVFNIWLAFRMTIILNSMFYEEMTRWN